MTVENFILALANESRKLPANGLRLLLHVAAKVIETANYTVTISDRQICEDLGIGRGHIGIVKGSISHLLKVHASAGVTSTFTVPRTWFDVQPTLFSTESGTLAGPVPLLKSTQVAPTGGHQWHPDGATDTPANEGTGTLAVPAVAPTGGQFVPQMGIRGTLAVPPPTQNQQVTDGSDTSSSISDLSTSSVERYFRIIDVKRVPLRHRASALVLSNELQRFMEARGDAETAKTHPDDALLARCLAVADISELVQVIDRMKSSSHRPKKYGWFLTVFVEHLLGISRSDQAKMRERYVDLMRGKPSEWVDGSYLTPETARQAFANVKTLR